jgi:hypothetical protein
MSKGRENWPIRKFNSFEEADEADREDYRRMTPDERVRVLLVLVDVWTGAPKQGLDRTYRVLEVPRR